MTPCIVMIFFYIKYKSLSMVWMLLPDKTVKQEEFVIMERTTWVECIVGFQEAKHTSSK